MRHILSTLLVCVLNIILADPQKDKDYEVCIQCVKGPRGKKGPQGWPGPQGLMGTQGPDGKNGTDSAWTSLNAFVNIYSDVAYTGIADGSIIPMNQVQALSAATDFVLVSGTDDTRVNVVQDGVYFITYNIAIIDGVNIDAPISVGVFVDGNIVGHCKYYSTVSRLPIVGQCLIPITAGSLVDVRNLSGNSVDLFTTEGEFPVLTAVKSSLMMVKVSDNTVMIVDENID